MQILVAGASGFVGTILSAELEKRGHKVFRADKTNAEYLFDLRDRQSMEKLLKNTSPDTVIFLAGISNVATAWESPAETFAINTSGALAFFESCLAITPNARFIFAGSAGEYDRACSGGKPFQEDDCCNPENPYAVSKSSAAQTMKMLAAKHGTQFVHLRLTNHYGPGQKKGFVAADFASQIAEKKRNSDNSEIKVGNLEAQKDFLYIDDVIEAYIKIAEAPILKYNTYNIGTGDPVPVRSILEILLKISEISAPVVVDRQKLRSADTGIMSLDITRIKNELNWYPRTPIEDGLRKTLQYWLNK